MSISIARFGHFIDEIHSIVWKCDLRADDSGNVVRMTEKIYGYCQFCELHVLIY